MVKICDLVYPKEEEESYKELYASFTYELHDFQKWAIQSIVTGHHTLITAPTGTGKSMPAEFAIDFFHSKGKKSIYCSPIKSLSNQKYHDFKQKYPHLSIGLITGDIKMNTDANVLIMTTEILLNKLYQLQRKTKETTVNSFNSFEMDIERELGCVIFDEIHMINDKDRGHVWENSLMLLPRHIQFIGLSATLDDPEKFAEWLETRGDAVPVNDKQVFLAKKLVRPVPLTHYSFITVNNGIFKAIKDKTVHSEIRSVIDEQFVIQSADGKFNELHNIRLNKLLNLFEKNKIRVSRPHVLNQVSKHLVENEMLPALCYVFSIKQLEKCAEEVTVPLLEFDSKIPYTIRRECEQIIRRLPNFEEYLQLPEYHKLVKLLEKGIAIHHSKMISILREIVEILFEQGKIKLLFCTTSVAIGLNLPVKTSIFTDIYKHDGESCTVLAGHEYVQAAGRAGRLGLDTVGHVIHLNNLFRPVETMKYKTMLRGSPQKILSKFKISYNLLLNFISAENFDFNLFAEKSMIQCDISKQLKELNRVTEHTLSIFKKAEEKINALNTPLEVIQQYSELVRKRANSVNKYKRDAEKQMQFILDEYTFVEEEQVICERLESAKSDYEKSLGDFKNTEEFVETNIRKVLHLLEKDLFISEVDGSKYTLTLKGIVASNIREVHCLVFGNLFEDKTINSMSSVQLVLLFSCFTNLKVSDDLKVESFVSSDLTLMSVINKVASMLTYFNETESELRVNTGTDCSISYDLLRYMKDWCDCETAEQCKFLIQTMAEEQDICLGEFVKCLLKIVNISNELERVAEVIGDIPLLSRLRKIPAMILKYVVTTQSLYV